MEARSWPDEVASMSPEDTLPSFQWPAFAVNDRDAGGALDEGDRASSTRLASELPTLPPPRYAGASTDVMVSHIHLGPSIDEVLYRLSLGDLTGAALANEELELCVPTRVAPRIVIAALELTYLEEFILASIDGKATWGELLDSSTFSPKDTLRALCELVDKGAVALSV